MAGRSNSTAIYRNASIAACLLGIVFSIVGIAMGGFASVAWAGFIGAGIALVVHGLIAIILSFVFPSGATDGDAVDAK